VLDDFDRDILLTHSEKLQVAECSLFRSSLSRVSVYLDAEIVSLVLPEEFTLGLARFLESVKDLRR
jgi:hypothetical protein